MNKLFSKIAGLSIGLAMAIGVGVAVASNSEAVPVHAAAGDSPIILDGTNLSLSSTATTEDTEKTYGGVTYVVSTGAKTLSSTGTNKFSATAILIGKSGTYIYNKTAIPGEITKFEVYANKGASAKVSVGVNFSATAALTSWTSTSATWTQTLSTLDSVYDASSKIVSGAKYFRYQVTNANNSQVEFRITYTAQKYTVTYNANNATSGTVPSDSTQYTNGSTVTVKGNTGSLARTGYTFGGWNTRADGTGTNYAAGSGTFSISANTTLYAKWNLNSYTVNGSGIINGSLSSTANVNHGDPLDIYLNPSSGYTYPDSITVTMGGSTLVEDTDYSYDDSTETHPGEIAILEVTGNIVITATCPSSGAVEYDIDYALTHCSITSAPSTMWSDDAIELTIVPADHYKLPAEDANKVSVTGAVDWYYDEGDGTITIDGAEDDLTITVECVAKAVNSISVTATNVTADGGNPTTVEEGATVTLTFTANEGYGLPTSSGVTVTGTGSSSTWTQGTGKLQITGGTGNISVSITGIVRSVTSISLSSNSGSYVLGDTFTMPTVTANYNVGASEEVTASATATGGGLENGVLTSSGTKTITISYGGQSATYTATVTAVVPSAGGIAKVTSTSDLTVGSTVYLVCEDESKQLSGISTTSTKYGLGADYVTAPSSTVYPLVVETGHSSGTYSFKNGDNYLNWSSGNSLSTNSTLSDNTSWTVTFNSSGNALLANKATPAREIWWNTSSPRFACYTDKTEQSTGYAPIQLYKNYPAVEPELKWITAEVKSGTYYQGSSVTASDFTVTAHYDDGNTSTPTTDITVTNGELNNIGANEVTITYGGKSCKVTVTAVEQTATLTGLAWAQGEYTIIDGQGIDFSELGTITAEYDDGDEYTTKSITQCSVATYTKNGNNYVKVADLDDGDEITSASHGKYLGVSYTEGLVTEYAYSSAPIYVVEAINDVYGKVEQLTFTTKASDTNPIAVGDTVVFAYDEENMEMVSITSGTKGVVESFTKNPAGTYPLTVVEGNSSGSFAFKDSSNKYISYTKDSGTTGNNYLYLQDDLDDKASWTISYDGTDATITNVHNDERSLRYNTTANQERISAYISSSTSFPVIQVYKGATAWVPSGDSIANTNAVVQKAVLEYAEHFNDIMNCVNSGSTTNVSSKWSTLSGDFDDLLDSFSSDNLAHCKALFAGADAVEEGDTLQDMLARYEYICAKYKLDDFLADIDRPPVSQRVNISLLNIAKNSGTAIAIIAISAVSLAAIGGYFLFCKKKEQ